MEMELPARAETTPPAASKPRLATDAPVAWPAVLLFFLAPAVAELLSTSSPPAEYFHLPGFLLLHASYGAMAVLLREWAIVRRIGTWGRVVLALTMGIFIEGVLCKTFFSPEWGDFNFALGYGRLAGVNWPWTVSLLVFHGLVSFLLPWFSVDQLWPRWRQRRSLNRAGAIGLGLLALAAGAVGFFNTPMNPSGAVYLPPLPHSLVAWGSLLLIPWLAARVREPAAGAKTPVNPTALAILTFFWWVVAQVVISWWMTDAEQAVPALIVVSLQLVTVALALGYARRIHGRLSEQHHLALLTGSAWFWCTLSVLASLDKNRLDNTSGAWIVGIVAFALVLMLGRLILRRERQVWVTQDLSTDEL